MLAQVTSGAVRGVDAYLVHVEVDLGPGLPSMTVVGLPESAVREGRERVNAALLNCGFKVPPRRITINLAPADVRKEGSAFDLPLALALLAASEAIDPRSLRNLCIVGELGLAGEIRPVRGVLSIAMRCREAGIERVLVPRGNAREAALVDGLTVLSAATLEDVLRHVRGERALDPGPTSGAEATTMPSLELDYADVKGQQHARRALEIAAAGQHNALLVGPPGAGKSMLARRLPSILPPPTRAEALEVTRIHSVAGRLQPGQGMIDTRPFRAPHHTISDAGLVGGGAVPRPGEVSLAHNGVLFLDELPEFRRSVLEVLRQPLEDGIVTLVRARIALSYPARFMLIAAMNPCPCGYYGTAEARCICHMAQIERYAGRVSGPLLDRIDLHVDVPAVRQTELLSDRTAESSATMRARVLAARERQLARFHGNSALFANAQMGPREVRVHCRVDSTGESLLRAAIERLGLSARAFHRILRLARTIADLQSADAIAPVHLAEAVQYRSRDRKRNSMVH